MSLILVMVTVTARPSSWHLAHAWPARSAPIWADFFVSNCRHWRARLKRHGKMSAVKLNYHWPRLHFQLPTWIGATGRALARLWSWFWGVIKLVGRTVRRLRPMVPGAIVAVLAAATIAAVVWLHSAARKSPDAWPSSVAAGTTATLALITLWYAYLTHRLLEAQRSAARTAGWETALRDLSLYLNRERAVIWTASDFFPIDRPGATPPGPHGPG